MSATSKKVRVRFAPSPTGYLHVGGVRTLLFNYLFAKRMGGTLVLRIEDTDQARSTRASEKMVLEDIAQLGMSPDEGPLQGGPHAPYRQSDRMAIYSEHARKLLEQDQAYFCFCTAETISQKREAALKLGRVPHYDGTCARISRTESESRIRNGERAGLRFRVPARPVVLEDAVRGRIEFAVGTVGDFMITRSPTPEEMAKSVRTGEIDVGMPVYNFCCVIDDYLMEITHVIRGEDHLSNTARQLMVYEGFGWSKPVFAHTAMVLGSDRQKLSKRNGDVSARDYLTKGYLPEALLNFLALLGWWPPQGVQPKSGHPEVLGLQELAQVFDLSGLQKAPAVFDMQKLAWMNGFYIKSMDKLERLKQSQSFLSEPVLKRWSADQLAEWLDMLQGDVSTLGEWNAQLEPYLDEALKWTPEVLVQFQSESGRTVLKALETDLETSAPLKELPARVGKTTGFKGKNLFMPLRLAVTAQSHGPELGRVFELLGREVMKHRLNELQIVLKRQGV